MQGHDIIVMGASVGGVEAFIKIVNDLPKTLNAAIFIVLHIPADSPSMLPVILGRAKKLPVYHGLDGAKIEIGKIYIAPPDHHLLLNEGKMRVVRGPRENRHRPAIDPLFRSAAFSYGSRVIGVVLTGYLDDGTAGLASIKQRNGLAVVQDPADALHRSMPRSAIENVNVDYCVPLAEIPGLLARLVQEPAPDAVPVDKKLKKEFNIEVLDVKTLNDDDRVGVPSAFSCPECNGVLWEINDGDYIRFRCRVGHAYSAETMHSGQAESVENALWIAIKTLEESATLSRRLSAQARKRDLPHLVKSYDDRVQEAEKRALVLRNFLLEGPLAKSSPDTNGVAISDKTADT